MKYIDKYINKTKSYTIPSFYKDYLDNIERGTVYDVSYETYREIVTKYFLWLRDLLLEESREVKLPYRLGTIEIVKHKPKQFNGGSLRIDYLATKKENKLVYLLNEHSDYYKYRLYWNKLTSNAINKSKYQMTMTRNNKRHLAQLIKNKIHDYREL